jgi:hypothetical protein
VVYAKLTVMDPLHEHNARLAGQLDVMSTRLQEKIAEIEMLSVQLGESDNKVRTLEERNTELTQQLRGTVSDLEQYEGQVQQSMSWFQANSTLDGHAEYNGIKRELEDKCMQVDGNQCRIKLGCLSFVNQQNNLVYKEDTAVSQREDFLQSLGDIHAHGGGDCEDFSLLFKAQIAHLRSACGARGANDVRFQSFAPSPGDKHYVEFGNQYYIEDTRDVDLPSDKQEVAMICGTMPAALFPDTISQTDAESFGHCLLGFSSAPLNAAADSPEFLRQSVMIEPQTGERIGAVAEHPEILVPVNAFPDKVNYLFMLVGDNDLYSFNAFQNRYQWFGYADFRRSFDEIKTALNATLAEVGE